MRSDGELVLVEAQGSGQALVLSRVADRFVPVAREVICCRDDVKVNISQLGNGIKRARGRARGRNQGI